MIHFLSDLHLAPGAPALSRLFFDYLGNEAREAERIFILGDLFEAWPGDDALDDPEDGFAREVAGRLRRLADGGTAVAIQHGNRDFLLGERFAQVSGAHLLPDPWVLEVPARRFVLTHGDALCAADADYQAYRARVRAPQWRAAFLAKPLEERKAAAAAMRRQSEAAKREKPRRAMDLDESATEAFLRQNPGATMIHGHTHLPARRTHHIDGHPIDRWTLADWKETRGEYLAWNGKTLTRHALGPAAEEA